MQNNLRGYWAEIMVGEILGERWRHTGGNWAGWDLERDDGCRIEVKQSALNQTWGRSSAAPRYYIGIAKGHYPDGKTYVLNPPGIRVADIYVFAWHGGDDQRDVSQWSFHAVAAERLPLGQMTIGLTAIGKLARPVVAESLGDEVARLCEGCAEDRR